MWVWLDSAGRILFDATLSSSLFLTLVVVATLICRQPTRRLLIARVAFTASLAMIPLVALLPLPRLDLLDTLVQTDLLPTAVIEELEELTPTGHPSVVSERQHQSLFAVELHDRLMKAGRWLPRSLTLIDLACVGMGLAWLLLGLWGVSWLIRHSRPPSNATDEIYDRIFAPDVPKHARPELRVSSRIVNPVVVGLFKPTILLPSGFDDIDRDAELLRLCLLHEVAHADQRDTWFGAIATLAQTVWFFLPQVWWLRSQLLIDQEFLADRSAAIQYGTSSGYAATLLSLAESRPSVSADAHVTDHSARMAGSKMIDVPSPLSQRVLMLLHCPFLFESRAPQSWLWTLRITLVIATLVTACLCIRWPDASALEHKLKHVPLHSSRPFRVTDFTAEPLGFSHKGRELPHVMPVALPSEFELTVEVLSTKAELEKVRIAGHLLAASQLADGETIESGAPSDDSRAWHHVRLKRSGTHLVLSIDGRPISTTTSAGDTTAWLTFEPHPERATQFRNLVVEW